MKMQRTRPWPAGVPHYARQSLTWPTAAQLARGAKLVASRRAAWIPAKDYPFRATKVLQMHFVGDRGLWMGRLYIDPAGQLFGDTRSERGGSDTWREARQWPTLLLYRGYELWPGKQDWEGGWHWEHEEHAGPGDDRSGWSKTLTEARAAIRALQAPLQWRAG